MNEFEKWYDTLNNCYTTDTGKRMQHMAWKAALESVLDRFPIEGYGGNVIRKHISDELLSQQSNQQS